MIRELRLFLEGFVIGATFPIQIIIYVLKRFEEKEAKQKNYNVCNPDGLQEVKK